MAHDYDAQMRETFETFAELRKQGEALPKSSVVEFYLLAEGDDCDWGACEKALRAKGYATERDDEGETLIAATKAALQITPEAIWDHEKAVTAIGLKFDFVPDGWEFGFD